MTSLTRAVAEALLDSSSDQPGEENANLLISQLFAIPRIGNQGHIWTCFFR